MVSLMSMLVPGKRDKVLKKRVCMGARKACVCRIRGSNSSLHMFLRINLV